jgi:hypothetical protein
MDMQDKELDELFSSKLDDLEMQPSARVWENISAGLADKKRKKRLVPFLSIAASITVLVASYVLFIPQKQSGGIHPDKNNVAATKTSSKNASSNILKADTNPSKTTPTFPVYTTINNTPGNHPTKKIRVVH